MTKSAKKLAPSRSSAALSAAKPLDTGKKTKTAKSTPGPSGSPDPVTKTSDKGATTKPTNLASGTKQSHVLAMLRSSTGATIAAMMQATGWQQHSVRGFLAGVVRKRLKLKLTSQKLKGSRVYQIADGGHPTPNARQAKARRAA